jgi:DNA polymerase-1
LAFPAYSTSADGTILLRGINFTEFSPWGNLVVLIPLIILGIMFSNLGYKAKLVLQVHDELIVDCPENEQDDVSKIVKTEMENAVSLRVPLTVELNVGKSWFDAK